MRLGRFVGDYYKDWDSDVPKDSMQEIFLGSSEAENLKNLLYIRGGQ